MFQSTVCKNIIEKLGQTNLDETRRQVVSISQDSFYRELNAAEKIKASKGQFNFDHPGLMVNFYMQYYFLLVVPRTLPVHSIE